MKAKPGGSPSRFHVPTDPAVKGKMGGTPEHAARATKTDKTPSLRVNLGTAQTLIIQFIPAAKPPASCRFLLWPSRRQKGERAAEAFGRLTGVPRGLKDPSMAQPTPEM
ncbi:hypothetical protein FJNA_02510 [Thermus sp. FJN-A]